MSKVGRMLLSLLAAIAVVLASGAWTVVTARPDTDSSGEALRLADAPAQESPAGEQAAPAAQEELGRIHIEYVPPKKPSHQRTYEAIKCRRVLERLK